METKLHVLNNVFAQVNQLVAKINVNFKMFKNIIREFNTIIKKQKLNAKVGCNNNWISTLVKLELSQHK